MQETRESIDRVGRVAADLTTRWAIPLLRVALGVTYVWFGVLKIAGVSPVTDLVGKMSFGVPRRVFVPFMGVWGAGLGLALLFRLALRPTLMLYFMQLAGTFKVFVAHPREAFRRGNPLLPTENGEFILKNLVLMAAGLALAGTVRHGREELCPPEREVPAEREPLRL